MLGTPKPVLKDDTDISVNINTCAETLPWTKTQADHFMSFNLDSTHLSRQGLLLSDLQDGETQALRWEGAWPGSQEAELAVECPVSPTMPCPASVRGVTSRTPHTHTHACIE